MHLVLVTPEMQYKGLRLSYSQKFRCEGTEIERLNFHVSWAATEIFGWNILQHV